VIGLLAFRHLLVRRVRAFFLLLGFGIGSATMIVLLSVGEAMLVQSRDVSLVGGGEITVLPQGVDLEALRTGAITGMYFGVDRARFVHRVMLGGPRQADIVADVTPVIEGKLVYLETGGRTIALRAGGDIPSRARAAGAGLEVLDGVWEDAPVDSAWFAPSNQQLYDQLDRFHMPAGRDSTWREWHYFNVVSGPEEWWYITYLVAGDIRGGNWGGQLLVTHRRPDGTHERFRGEVPREAVRFETTRADLLLGESEVSQRSGLYFLDGVAQGEQGVLRFQLTVRPERRRYFPPVELRSADFVSGYVVPALRATASGRICLGVECNDVREAPAYHDHNWGVWGGVTWEWGQGRGRDIDLLYGGVTRDGDAVANPYFFALVDSLGMRQVLRFAEVRYEGVRPVAGERGVRSPGRFTIVAVRDQDRVTLEVRVLSALATRMGTAGLDRYFLQMRGAWALTGEVDGELLADEGFGFFETHVTVP
jgi:hypothetical protein